MDSLLAFPILFVAYDRGGSDVLSDVVRQLEIAKATEFFALLIVIPPRGRALRGARRPSSGKWSAIPSTGTTSWSSTMSICPASLPGTLEEV